MINTPLGLSQPYGVFRKCDAEGAMVFDNFIGGMFGMASTDMNNAMNHRIAEETNQANREINEQQIAYAREQYERERMENRFLVDQAYQRSSPVAQKARYLAAGINPYLAMSGSGGSAGSAGAIVGSPARGNQPQAVPMQIGHPMERYPSFGLGIAEAAQYSLAAERQEADISAIKQKTQQDWLETFSKINSRNWANKKIQQEVNELILKNAFTKQTWDESARNVKLINDKLFADIQYQEAMTKFQNIVNDFEPKAREQTLQNLEANYDKIMSEVYANNEEAAYKAALSSITDVEEQIKRDCADAVVDECYNKANEAYYHSQQAAKNLGEGEVIGRSLPAQTYDGSYRQYGDKDRKYVRSSVPRSAKKRVILK